MPSSTDTAYSAATELPELIERGTTCVLRCPVYLSGALVAPTLGTVSLYDAAGVVVIDEADVTIAGTGADANVAVYSYAAPTTLTLGEGWRIEWTLTLSSVVHVFRNTAAVVRRRLYCPVTDAHLFKRVRGLDPANGDDALSGETTFQWAIDEAWTMVQRRLIEAGKRPNLIVEPSALFDATIELVLALIFDNLASYRDGDGGYSARAVRHRQAFESAWSRVRLPYATGDAETYDPTKRATAVVSWWFV